MIYWTCKMSIQGAQCLGRKPLKYLKWSLWRVLFFTLAQISTVFEILRDKVANFKTDLLLAILPISQSRNTGTGNLNCIAGLSDSRTCGVKMFTRIPPLWAPHIYARTGCLTKRLLHPTAIYSISVNFKLILKSKMSEWILDNEYIKESSLLIVLLM